MGVRAEPALAGACSCGACCITYRPGAPAAWLERIACPCSLCRRTGAWFVLDPRGECALEPAAAWRETRLSGDPDARDLLCPACGDYLGSVWTLGARQRIALNARLLEAGAFAFPGTTDPVHAGAGARGFGRIPELPVLRQA